MSPIPPAAEKVNVEIKETGLMDTMQGTIADVNAKAVFGIADGSVQGRGASTESSATGTRHPEKKHSTRGANAKVNATNLMIPNKKRSVSFQAPCSTAKLLIIPQSLKPANLAIKERGFEARKPVRSLKQKVWDKVYFPLGGAEEHRAEQQRLFESESKAFRLQRKKDLEVAKQAKRRFLMRELAEADASGINL
jgi:hypothetical protein